MITAHVRIERIVDVRERIRTKGVVDGHLADPEIVAGRSHVDAEQLLHGRLQSPNETLCPAAGGMGETTPVPSASARILRQPTTPSRKRGVGSDRRPLCESGSPKRLEPFRSSVGSHMLCHEAADFGGKFESMAAEPDRDE